MLSITVSLNSSQMDADYQHAHHTTAIHLMEQARSAFMEAAGLPRTMLMAQDLWPVISKIRTEYFRELKTGQYIATCDRITVERRRLVFEQRILDLSGQEIAEATINIMWPSKKAGRAITPPGDVMAAIIRQINISLTTASEIS